MLIGRKCLIKSPRLQMRQKQGLFASPESPGCLN